MQCANANLRFMKGNRPAGLFIAGVDTEVGKTYVGAMLAREIFSQRISVGVYKPVASGCVTGESGALVSSDALSLWMAAGRPETLERVCPKCYAAPIAPPTAARAQGDVLSLEPMIAGANWWRERSDFLIVEGAGGLLSPLGHDFDNRDFAAQLGLPILLVAANRLGVINAVRLCVEAITKHASTKLTLAGIVINEPAPPQANDVSVHTNVQDIEYWLPRTCAPVPPLYRVRWGETALVFKL